ncbi:MAG: hypothetical protein H6532_01215 [Thermoleophilales bacterium]|nr:hypothetical protein [Thermoleophilales bacterium]
MSKPSPLNLTQIFLFGGLLLVCLAAGIATANLNLSLETALIVSTAIVVAIPIVLRVVSGKFDPFEPIAVFSVIYALMFVARPLYFDSTGETLFKIGSETVDFGPYVVEMQVAALIGAIAFVVGYEVVTRSAQKPRPRLTSISSISLKQGGLVLCALGLVGTFFYLRAFPGGYSALAQGRSDQYHEISTQMNSYFYYFPDLLLPGAFIMLLVWLRTKDTWPLLVAVGSALILFAIRLPVGSRLGLLPLFGTPFVFWYLYRNKRPGIVGLATVVLVLAIGWSLVLQNRYQSTGLEQTSYVGSLKSIVEDPGQLLDPVTKDQDVAMAPGFASAMSVVPSELPFRYGLGMTEDLITRGVPRQFWAGKPLAPREKVISELWPKGYKKSISNPEFSILFHFYYDGWYVGVMLGMFLLGLLFRAIRDLALSRPVDPLYLVAYALVLCNMPMILRDSVTDSVLRLSFSLLPLLIVGWWASRRFKTSNRSLATYPKSP